MVVEIDLRLTPKPEVVTDAYHALDRLTDPLPPEKLEEAQLVMSKLVPKSTRHAGLSPDDQISLTVTVLAGSVGERVCDPGSGFEVLSTSPTVRSKWCGWKLPIVERISGRWRIERNRHMGVVRDRLRRRSAHSQYVSGNPPYISAAQILSCYSEFSSRKQHSSNSGDIWRHR